MNRTLFALIFWCLACPAFADTTAARPLYRDPVHDGAADPTLIWNAEAKTWWLFYTNRRARLADEVKDASWVHGTRVGIAESKDGGANWSHVGEANIPYPSEDYTLWAPDILAHEGTYHMFLTVVPGTFPDWKHLRAIQHLTSSNLRDWTYVSTLALSSDRVIDADVVRLPDGTWRLWYNDERDGKAIYYADSPDLRQWTDRGKVAGVNDRGGEGPQVIHWKGSYWLIKDTWRGLAVYKSSDAASWTPQAALLLDQPGTGTDDAAYGNHADVIVHEDRAFLIYFTHPGRTPGKPPAPGYEGARSTLHLAELFESDGTLRCDRNAPVRVDWSK